MDTSGDMNAVLLNRMGIRTQRTAMGTSTLSSGLDDTGINDEEQ